MEVSEAVPVPVPTKEKEFSYQSSSPKSDLEHPTSDPDNSPPIDEQLQNLSLKDAEERCSSKEEESENGNDSGDQSKSEVESENVMRRRYSYPVRPDAEDCAYYMKTGNCKFGSNCKFNHPVRRKNQGVKEKVKEREEKKESVERQGQNLSKNPNQNQNQIECKYYLSTGGCKYGKACRYSHSKAKPATDTTILELNFLGLPIRPGEKECPYYMRNGSCKYGAQCRFNHPDPMVIGSSDAPSGYANGAPVSPQAASQASIGSWSSPRALNDSSPFMPMMFSPTHGVPSQNPEWNGYQAPVYAPPESSMHPAPAYFIKHPTMEANVYTSHRPPMVVDEFPERPGQPECSFYMKTGDCKFKSNCKYHHPKNRTSKSQSCALSDKGLPLRPGQSVCSHYSRYGICKFGPACKYDHPMSFAASSTESLIDPLPSYDDSGTTEEDGAASNENGSC